MKQLPSFYSRFLLLGTSFAVSRCRTNSVSQTTHGNRACMHPAAASQSREKQGKEGTQREKESNVGVEHETGDTFACCLFSGVFAKTRSGSMGRGQICRLARLSLSPQPNGKRMQKSASAFSTLHPRVWCSFRATIALSFLRSLLCCDVLFGAAA